MKKLLLSSLLLLMSPLVLAWPLSDPADELVEAWYAASCCINEALQSNPHQTRTENCEKLTNDVDLLTCFVVGERLKQEHRNRLGSEFCGELAITAQVKLEECENKYKGGTCTQAIKVAKARAFRECPTN